MLEANNPVHQPDFDGARYFNNWKKFLLHEMTIETKHTSPEVSLWFENLSSQYLKNSSKKIISPLISPLSPEKAMTIAL